MSVNASGNSSDGASAHASQSTTSPFSPHATAFGPTSSMNLGTSNRIHGLASDGQSPSSRASSFASSAHDHAASSGPKAISIVSSNQAPTSNLSGSPYTSANATPPSAGLFGFNDRIRNSNDHSRQSSGGAGSNFSAASSANAFSQASSGLRRSHSPLPHHMSGGNNSASSQTDLFNQSHSSGFNGRSPTSLVPPFTGHEQRRLSSSGLRNDSPSLLQPDAGAAAARPPFGRQSFSDGPSSSPTNLLSADPTSAMMETRQGSFPGDASGTMPASQSSSNTDPMSGLGAPAPSTGPLSASDPRTQLLVSNLPYRVRWQDLKDLFRKAGTVLRADVSLSADNRSRGYGTVLMATEQDAIKAADMLGGFTWQGRSLDVRVDRSGTLVGVAGSAVMPTLATSGLGNGASPSPIHIANGPLASNQSLFGGVADQSQFLGLPSGYMGSQSHSPGSLAGAASPSALSPLARAVDASQPISTRASFSALPDATLGGGSGGGNGPSELERAMFQTSNNGTPNRQRPGSTFDSGFPQHRAVSSVQSLGSNQMGSRRGSEVGAAIGMANASPASGLWASGANDAASNLYQPNAGGSSVPTGFPGATAMAPWPQGPGALGNPAMTSMQSHPFNSQMPTTSYAGRVLFVGNLPFHCQWQDLKDLFRAAGNIQRADVAIGPDGRSRGFGTVLFASQEDAQNAVRLYHGYEYSGRTLKVHFDRFAAQNGPAIGTPGNPAQYTGAFAAAALPSHMTSNVRAPAIAAPMQAQPMQGGFGQQPYPQQTMQQQQRSGGAFMPQQQAQASSGQAAFQAQNPASLAYASQYQPSMQMQSQQQQQQQKRFGQQQQYQPQQQTQQQQMAAGFSAFADAGRTLQGTSSQNSFSMFGNALNSSRQNADGSTASDRRGSTAKAFGLYASSESTNEEDETTSSSGRENDYGMSITLPANGFGAASSYLPSDLMSPGLVSPPAPTNNSQHPGRIQLPSSNFANSFGAAMGAGQDGDQMSPMAARMQVPMTPGMPGFTFHQVPETPPLYPQFLSPGIGAFSPTIGGSTSQTGAAGGTSGASHVARNGGMGDYMTAAPGGPAGYNPMFPMSGAGYGQQQPATPHWSQPSGPRRAAPVRQSTGMYGSSALDRSSDEVVDDVRSNIAKTPGAGPRRPSHAAIHTDEKAGGGAGGNSMNRQASDVTPGSVEPSMSDGYPFPMVAAGNVSHLTRRASTNSPAGTPMASGPSGGSRGGGKDDSATAAGLSTGEMLAGASAEELANTIARLSVKGTALAKVSGSRRSLSMTAERSAAASAMAKLREKAGTPTPPAQEESSDVSALGAPFGADSRPTKPSPLANALQQGADAKQEPIEQLLGLKMSNSVLEAARNGSALETCSDAGGSRRGTPQDEVGPTKHTA